MRADVCHRIEQIVANIWPNAITETIGSTCTDLCVPTSDIDMVIFGVTLSQQNSNDGVQVDANTFAIECLYKLAKNLEEIAQRNSIEVIDTAKVPIIKMRDKKSGIEVDISFGVTSGKENSKVVLEYCKKYPLVKPLTLVIKYYLK
jgi:non-canonical poly(A) RNA polymerase PAPD5/7